MCSNKLNWIERRLEEMLFVILHRFALISNSSWLWLITMRELFECKKKKIVKRAFSKKSLITFKCTMGKIFHSLNSIEWNSTLNILLEIMDLSIFTFCMPVASWVHKKIKYSRQNLMQIGKAIQSCRALGYVKFTLLDGFFFLYVLFLSGKFWIFYELTWIQSFKWLLLFIYEKKYKLSW